jgi:hypothetical protein
VRLCGEVAGGAAATGPALCDAGDDHEAGCADRSILLSIYAGRPRDTIAMIKDAGNLQPYSVDHLQYEIQMMQETASGRVTSSPDTRSARP